MMLLAADTKRDQEMIDKFQHAQKLKYMAKENPDYRKDANGSRIHKKRLFAYSFAKMDLETRLYIAFRSSMKS